MEDIKFGNPNCARQLIREHGKKGAIKFLKEFLDKNDKLKAELQKTLLEQMPKTHNPYEYRTQELQAHELATEMAQEEVRQLYNPPTTEPSAEVAEFLQMLRM